LFDIWTFPQIDYSLKTWVERLSEDMKKAGCKIRWTSWI
jgi:hypothetical protein